MKTLITSLSLITFGFFVACKSTKAVPVTTSPASSSAASTNGIMIPTNTQLLAVRAKYPDVTMDELSEGHKIYVGVCTNCHGAKSIYNRDETRWTKIIANMAPKAQLSDVQTAQLTKYVMSIKASQPAGPANSH